MAPVLYVYGRKRKREYNFRLSMSGTLPPRTLLVELSIAGLIFIGSFSASLISAICISVAVMAPFHTTEGNAFVLLPLISCAGLLINPGVFAAFASKHIRVRSLYVIACPVPWLVQAWHVGMNRTGWIAIAASAVAGLALAHRGIRSQSNRLHLEKKGTA
jgi:hypothetical protein